MQIDQVRYYLHKILMLPIDIGIPDARSSYILADPAYLTTQSNHLKVCLAIVPFKTVNPRVVLCLHISIHVCVCVTALFVITALDH